MNETIDNDDGISSTEQFSNLRDTFPEISVDNNNAFEGHQKARKTCPSIEAGNTEVEAGDREVEQYQQLGYNHYHAGQYQESIAYYKVALELASQFGNTKSKYDAFVGLGNAFNQIGEMEASRNYFSEALLVSGEINEKSVQTKGKFRIKKV